MDSAGKAKEQQGKVEHHAQLFGPLLEDVLADVQPQTEYKWRECFDALQEAKNSLLSVSGVSPMQVAFCRKPGILGDLRNPDLIASSSLLHDRGAGQAARVRTIARTKLMLHSDKPNARRALDTRPRVVPTFLPGDMVAVWRMTKGGGIPGKQAHHRWRPGICVGSVRGNYWIAVPGSVVMASPKHPRPAAREERHVWRVVEAEMRTKLATGNNKITSS